MTKFLFILSGILLAGVALIVIMLLSYAYTGGGSYTVSLPGDYTLHRVHGNHVVLSMGGRDGGEVIVGAPIDGYAIHRHLVIGHARAGEKCGDSDYGYFVLNTKSGVIVKGLDRKRWLMLLRKNGLSADLTLRRPSRFAIFRRPVPISDHEAPRSN